MSRLSVCITYYSCYFPSQSSDNTVDLGLVYIMQLNVLYLVIVSACIAITSAVNPLATNSCLNAINLTATNASTDTNSPLDFTAWTGPNCKQSQSNAHKNLLLNHPLGTGYMFEVGDISMRYKWQIILANANAPFSSFRLSRPLKEREQLDLSQTLGSNSCGRFLRSYGPQDSPGKGLRKRNSSKLIYSSWMC
jgi:hypothetical protein